jgi:hypothetical protein
MRRRTLLVALAGLAVVAAAGAVVLWPRPERITRENFDRIRDGITRADVEAILGPPGDYRTGHGEMDYGTGENTDWTPDSGPDFAPRTNWSRLRGVRGQSSEDPSLRAGWIGDSFAILIVVDKSGQVTHKSLSPRRTTQGPLDNLLWRVKRQWRRWFP